MARLQFQSSTKTKGFAPPQINKEILNQMRLDTDRAVAGIKNVQKGAAEQAKADLDAMRANSDYEERRLKENATIDIQNQKNKLLKIQSKFESEQKQAKINSDAIQSVFTDIINFADSAKKDAARRTQQMIKDQFAEGFNTPVDPRESDQYKNSLDVAAQGAVQLSGEIEQSALEEGEDRYQTMKAHIANSGYSIYKQRGMRSRALMTFNSINLSNAFKSSDKIYDDGSGNLFSGAEAYSDPEKMAIVQYEVLTNTATNLGISNNLEVSEALKLITTQNNTLINQAKTRSETKSREILTADINEHLLNAGIGGETAVVQAQLAWNNLKILKGDNALAHQAWRERIATGNYDQKTVDAMLKVDVFGDGKSYLDVYSTQLAPFLRQREDSERKKNAAEQKYEFQELKDRYINSKEGVTNFINNSPNVAESTIRRDFAELGATMPAYLSEQIRVAKAGNKEELLYRIEERGNLGVLSDSEINTYPSGEIREFAVKQKQAQDIRSYGENYTQVKKGFTSLARKETGILDRAPGSFQTSLYEAALDVKFKELYKGDANQTQLELEKLILDGKLGEGTNTENTFYRIKRNGRMYYPNIEGFDEDSSKRRQTIMSEVEDKGLGFFSKEYAMNTSQEMDEMFESSLSGPVKYTPIVYKVANILSRKTGETVTPAKVFNYARKIDNEKTGLNKPYLQISANQERFEQEAADKELDKILSNPDSTAQELRRVGASFYGPQGTERKNFRLQTSVNSLQTFSPQVSSITFDEGQPGIDIFFEDKNFPAVLSGSVKDIGYQVNPDGSGYGNYLVIESIDPETGEPVDVLYSHLETKPSQSIGQNINSGQIIGKQGGTGSVQSADGTIASIDFLAPAPRGSKSMTPYKYYDSLRRTIASQFQ